MMHPQKIRGLFRKVLLTATLAPLLLAVACTSRYGADVRNRTSLPLSVVMFERSHDRTMTLATRRLGPGDRGFVGPATGRARLGSVFLAIDTAPNPDAPATIDLLPGTTYVEVTTETEQTRSPLRIRVIE